MADLNRQETPAKSEKSSKRNSDPQDLLNLMFERGPDYVLIEAAKSGDDEIVKLLIENEEVDINAKDGYGYTALCYAALKGLKNLLYCFILFIETVPKKNKTGDKDVNNRKSTILIQIA